MTKLMNGLKEEIKKQIKYNKLYKQHITKTDLTSKEITNGIMIQVGDIVMFVDGLPGNYVGIWDVDNVEGHTETDLMGDFKFELATEEQIKEYFSKLFKHQSRSFIRDKDFTKTKVLTTEDHEERLMNYVLQRANDEEIKRLKSKSIKEIMQLPFEEDLHFEKDDYKKLQWYAGRYTKKVFSLDQIMVCKNFDDFYTLIC